MAIPAKNVSHVIFDMDGLLLGEIIIGYPCYVYILLSLLAYILIYVALVGVRNIQSLSMAIPKG